MDHGRHRIHPGVYAVGHSAPSTEADLAAALLYAGPGAMLSHATAIWWLELSKYRPRKIHLSTPHRRPSRPGIAVHARRDLPRIEHRGLPITTVAQALLDYAPTVSHDHLRYVVAETEYKQLLDLREVRAVLRQGRRGSTRLGAALEHHDPRLARTRSLLERGLLGFCEDHGIPLPQPNVTIAGMTVDALWPAHRLVVEMDGGDGHRTWAQIKRDRSRELKLRKLGYTVIRYTWDQLLYEGDLVAEELRRLLSSTGTQAARGSR